MPIHTNWRDTFGVTGEWTIVGEWSTNHSPLYSTTTGTAITNDHRWITWGSTTSSSTPYQWGEWGDMGWTPDCAPYNNVETVADPARIQELERRRRAADAAMVERSAARIVATSKADELLCSLLPEAQVESYRVNAHFEVIGSHGTLYRINVGVAGNIEWLRPDGTVGGKLCAHPSMRDGRLPTPDVMLSQFLALVTDEREFLRKANLHAGQRPAIARLAA